MNKTAQNIITLIVAGGYGSRMDNPIPKQYLKCHGKTILRHTIEKFLPFGRVYCVIAPNHDDLYQQAVSGLDLPKPLIGGKTRQESVHNGLKALESFNPDYILIHDAARPCIYPQDIHNVINGLNEDSALTLAQKVTDSTYKGDEQIDRDNLWLIQTPQAFPYQKILKYHDSAAKNKISATDDTSIARTYGLDVHYIESGRHNIKITTKDDLNMAEKLLLPPNMETRVGNGFDVHAFDHDKQSSHIRLCGIDIPHEKSLKGHSDADVGLHAITDALFGAMGEGDIGIHFPPSDQNFKDMDSHIFLDRAVDMLGDKGGKIIHIDVTFMCEEPKIGKFRDHIIDHLSTHLNLDKSRVSIKATTTEKLGFTGRQEGIACQATATIQLPSS